MSSRLAEVEVDAEVTPSGDIVIPSQALGKLTLQPHQRVRVTVNAPPPKNMYGVLAGRAPDVSLEEFDESSRDAWGEFADG